MARAMVVATILALLAPSVLATGNHSNRRGTISSTPPTLEGAAYVDLVGESFRPFAAPEDYFTANTAKAGLEEQADFAQAYSSTFVQLPTSGTGFESLSDESILWGRPTLVYGFMEAARAWSLAGGENIQVYAISPQNTKTTVIDNAEGTFWESHVYGNRKYNRPTIQGNDAFNITGTAMDIREFASDEVNDFLINTIQEEVPLKVTYIYDMMTMEEIACDYKPIRSPLHIESGWKKETIRISKDPNVVIEDHNPLAKGQNRDDDDDDDDYENRSKGHSRSAEWGRRDLSNLYSRYRAFRVKQIDTEVKAFEKSHCGKDEKKPEEPTLPRDDDDGDREDGKVPPQKPEDNNTPTVKPDEPTVPTSEPKDSINDIIHSYNGQNLLDLLERIRGLNNPTTPNHDTESTPSNPPANNDGDNSVQTPVSAPSSTTGDLNQDGNVSMVDAALVSQYLHGYVELNAEQISAADVNGDGKVTDLDRKAILQIVVGN